MRGGWGGGGGVGESEPTGIFETTSFMGPGAISDVKKNKGKGGKILGGVGGGKATVIGGYKEDIVASGPELAEDPSSQLGVYPKKRNAIPAGDI